MKNYTSDSELNLEKLFKTIKNYKWLILTLMLITSILMFANLYFTPSIYNSSSIVEIKSKSKPNLASDLLLGALSFGSSGKTEKEIEILRTFLIHKKVLEKINFQINYYQTLNYKDIEIYEKVPLKITNIKIKDKEIIGKKFIITPKNGGFTITIDKNPLLSLLSNSQNSETVYQYNTDIENEYFKLHVSKNTMTQTPIKFILNGDNREVYDEIITKRIKISKINPNAPLIKISFEDNIPNRANDYVNAISASFIELSITRKNEQNNKILQFINKKLDAIREQLQSSENKLENFKVSNQIVEPSIQAKTFIQKLTEVEIQLSENSLKEKLINSLLSFVRHNNNLDAIAPSLMELNDKPTLQLISSLQSLQLEEANLQTELTDQHPKLITVRKQMYHIKQKILFNIKNLKSLIKQKNTSLLSKKKIYEIKIQELPTKEKKLVNIQRDYRVSTTLYDYLLKKKTESELLIVSTLSDYKIIDKAHTSSHPIKPKRALMMIISPLIGLLLGVILATILKASNRNITNLEELESLTDLPIIGLIPRLHKKEAKLEVFNSIDSPFTESYRSLRTHISNKQILNQAHIVSISSIVASEGKTTVTSNLASIFQMAGCKSIILSLDLRKPSLHNYFNLPNNKGMSTYLSGEDSIQDIIFATKYTNLHVVTSGPIPTNPSELLLSNKLIKFLEILKTRYDYIFIDTPPVGLVSDTVQIMQLSDTNIIVLRENFAEKSFLTSLDNIIEKNNLKNINLVLNMSDSKKHGYYGYGYGENSPI